MWPSALVTDVQRMLFVQKCKSIMDRKVIIASGSLCIIIIPQLGTMGIMALDIMRFMAEN